MRRGVRLSSAAIIAWVAVPVLAGCTASEPTEFSRDQTNADRLSPLIEGDPGVDLESTRFVGTTGEFKIYIARSPDGQGTCGIAVRADDDQWVSTGCSDGDGVGMELEDGTQLEFGNFRLPEGGERTPLSDSVSVVQ